MPYVERSNNRLIPANSRAADVAEKAISEIMPIQQERMMNAFRPQGIAVTHYSHLRQGRKCTCQAAGKALNTRLDKDGKASQGTINALITGQPEMSFEVTPYNFNQQRVTGVSDETSPWADGQSKQQGVFDIKTQGEEFPFADIVDGPDFGDNGPTSPIDLDALVRDFDVDGLGFGDVRCPVCFGTGYIGGYAPDNAHRQVLNVNDVVMAIPSELHITDTPWTADSVGFTTTLILPLGAVGVDSFRVWNLNKPVPGVVFVLDGREVNSYTDVLSKCDGKVHVLQATFNSQWSHFELQFPVSTESAYFEFPRRSKSADTNLLDTSEPFQIILSPNIPNIEETDIITESQLGKTLIVQSVNPWNSRRRDVLGWEAQVRVIQPQEIYRILPQRGRVMTKNRTPAFSRDNVTGPRRT